MHFPPAFVSVPYVNFRGVYLSTKFQGKFRMIQNEGKLLMDFVEDSFFTRKLPCWISDLFWDGTCLQKNILDVLKKKPNIPPIVTSQHPPTYPHKKSGLLTIGFP